MPLEKGLLSGGVNLASRDGSKQEPHPSHDAIDNGNPADFKPKWLVLDDVNIDMLSIGLTAAALISVLAFQQPAKLVGLAWASAFLPLRIFLPRPKTPEGLVLITGASSGIGAELTYIFAEKGHDLVLVGRNEEQLKAVQRNVKEKFGRDSYTVTTDLSLPGSAKQLYDHITKEKGLTVDVLVNGAGLGGAGHTLDQPIELTERMTILNCVTPVQLSQLFGRDMVKRGKGWMLQISSVGGKFTLFSITPLLFNRSLTLSLSQAGSHLPVRTCTTQASITSAPSPKPCLSSCAPTRASSTRS